MKFTQNVIRFDQMQAKHSHFYRVAWGYWRHRLEEDGVINTVPEIVQRTSDSKTSRSFYRLRLYIF